MGEGNFKSDFGKRVLHFRKKKGLSYRKTAQLCNIDHSNIHRIEKGEYDVRLSTIIELANALEIHPKELLDF